MDRHCPVFILESAATFVCDNFLTGTLPLDLICKKVCDHISKEYKELPLEDLQDVAEAFLRVLAEANVDEADIVLKIMLSRGLRLDEVVKTEIGSQCFLIQ